MHMQVRIKSINNQGGYEDEYATLEVLEDCDIGGYLLSDSTYTDDGKVSSKLRHVYWFPDKQVKKGDFVRLYTRPFKAGENRSWSNTAGSTTHSFFWGLRTAVWNDAGDCAVLFDIRDWKSKKVGDASR